MNLINIFESKKKIDMSTLIDSRMLICANSGGGKSYAIRKIIEESHGKVMSIILDVEGEFKTLREKYDFLLIGKEGDVPLNMKSAHLLPQKLMELNISTIIDISDLKRPDRITYVKKFLESLMELPRKYWKPCLIVLDEVHQLAGQQEKQDSTYSVIDVATRGRKRGYCLVACTQRIAKLHKDVVAELNNYMVGRTGLDIDMKRAGEILGFIEKKMSLSLRDLEPGEFYVFGTAISKGVQKEKIGEVQTTHPRVGMDLTEKIVPPTSKIKNMLAKLSDLPQKAEEELKEKGDYIRRIRSLEAQIRVKGTREVTKVVSNIGEVRELNFKIKNLERKLIPTERNYQIQKQKTDQFQKQSQYGENIIRGMYPVITKLIQVEKNIAEFFKKPKMPKIKAQLGIPKEILKTEPSKIERPKDIQIQMDYQERRIEHPDILPFEEGQLNKCAKLLYGFLFANSDRAFTKVQIAVMTGYSVKSGGFQSAMASLNTKDLILKEGNLIRVNPDNLDPEISDEQEEFSLDLIKKKLNKCSKELLEILIENPSQEYSKEELAETSPSQYSYTSGGFQSALAKLNTLGFIEKIGGRIRLSKYIEELI